jgi:hypothetical protein
VTDGNSDSRQNKFRFVQAMSAVAAASTIGADACVMDTGAEAWALVAFVLVLFMFPALVLFQSGLLRVKHSLSIAMQVFSAFIIMTLMYAMPPKI